MGKAVSRRPCVHVRCPALRRLALPPASRAHTGEAEAEQRERGWFGDGCCLHHVEVDKLSPDRVEAGCGGRAAYWALRSLVVRLKHPSFSEERAWRPGLRDPCGTARMGPPEELRFSRRPTLRRAISGTAASLRRGSLEGAGSALPTSVTGPPTRGTARSVWIGLRQ
jgi:hypothetical protein